MIPALQELTVLLGLRGAPESRDPRGSWQGAPPRQRWEVGQAIAVDQLGS